MDFGFRCRQPAHRPCPASLPVRFPTVVGLPLASFSFGLILPSINTVTYVGSATNARLRRDDESMPGHRQQGDGVCPAPTRRATGKTGGKPQSQARMLALPSLPHSQRQRSHKQRGVSFQLATEPQGSKVTSKDACATVVTPLLETSESPTVWCRLPACD